MAGAWLGGAPMVFNVNRTTLLGHPLPPFRAGDQPSSSTTTTRYRLRWHQLHIWNDFADQVVAYWNSVPPHDRNAMVATQNELQGRWQRIANNPRILNESDVTFCVQLYPLDFHSYAANGEAGAPMPTDAHSAFYPCGLGASSWNLAGVPDFVMHYINRVTALIEVKNPWLVTPQRINEVLNGLTPHTSAMLTTGTAPIEGEHAGRLAVEQLYGYMVRNGKTLGILTTMKGWCFIRRFNGGILHITPIYGDFPAWGNIITDATQEGYNPTPSFSILKALYYFSHLAAVTNDTPETPTNGQVGHVHLPYASGDTATAAPRIYQPPAIAPGPQGQAGGYGYGYVGQGYAYTITGGYETADDYRVFDTHVDFSVLKFEPWVPEYRLGPKNWIAHVVSNGRKVILKMWDAWKFDSSLRDHELSIYLQIKSLWGNIVPSLFMSTPIEFFHALILEYLDVRTPYAGMLI